MYDGIMTRGEWLVNSDGSIMVRTLREWFDILRIYPVTVNGLQMWKSEHKRERNGLIDIEGAGGYYLTHDNARQHFDELYFAGNADFDVKLRRCK